MEAIQIGTYLSNEDIKKIIKDYPLKKKIKVDHIDYKDRSIYYFSLGKRIDLEETTLYDSLTKLIQEIIIKVYSIDLVSKRLSVLLTKVDDKEKREIHEGVLKILRDERYLTEEKNQIKDEIFDYLIKNKTLIIDGYLRFRSDSFIALIDKAIDKTIMDIQMEIEYEEFIDMLQYYVDIQLPKMELINVIIKKGDFELIDSEGQLLNSESINQIVEDVFFDGINKSDILVSSLIVLSPEKIIVHIENDREKELIMILKRIFSDRVVFCYECSLCNTFAKKHEEFE